MTPSDYQNSHMVKNFLSFFMRSVFLGSFIICPFFSPELLADKLQSNEEIRTAAMDFVRAQIPKDVKIQYIKAGKIDSRVHFKECSQALEAYSSMNKTIAKSWTIGVRCNDDSPWSIYIPVKSKLTRKMLVSKTTITRGELITTKNIERVDREITHQNQKYFSDHSNVIGREARRTINPNRIINSSMLQQALLVKKKETVLIYAQNKNIRVSMKGTALKNGRQNEMIQVRNNSSKKVIEALVVDRGIVAVNF